MGGGGGGGGVQLAGSRESAAPEAGFCIARRCDAHRFTSCAG
jgi:hypothetical protein